MVPQAEIPGENAVRGLSKDPEAHWHSWRSSEGEREREGERGPFDQHCIVTTGPCYAV